MATWERPAREGRNPQRRKTPSFSSSLLDAIYHSIDESEGKKEEEQRPEKSSGLYRRNNALEVEEEIANLRRAIMIEKWMENYPTTKSTRGSRRVNSDSSSSTDSSFFSSSETESASKSTPKSSVVFHAAKPVVQKYISDKAMHYEKSTTTTTTTTPKHEGRFMRTKSRALKMYGDLKKVKQPISPGGKIANFLNSIFNSRNLKKHHQGVVEDWSSVRKSRSVKDSTPCSLTSRSCLNRPPPPSSRTKSKRSVRFCPVGVIVDEDSQPCGHKNIIYDNDPSLTPMPIISSHYIKKNIDSFRNYEEKNPKKHKYRGFYNVDSDDDDDDDADDDGNSCTSSDLFELENIGVIGIGANREELPVYGTTNLKMNQAIAKGLFL